MTTGRINQVAPSMTPARMSPPRASGGVNTRTTVVRFQRRLGIRIHGVEAYARSVFCIPEHSQRPQPRPHAHGGATRVDDSPSPNGPRDTPRGHRAKDHLVRVQAAFTRHATQETVLCPGLCLPLDHPLKRIVRGRFTARAGSPPTQTNRS